MPNQQAYEQAAALSALISKLIRSLHALDVADPAMDLPVAQLRACVALLEKPRSITCLSKELGISLSATTQLADRLEKSGLIERLTDSDDQRMKRVRLTAQGEEIMNARRERRIERITRVLALIPANDRDLIVPVLQKLHDASLALGQSEVDMLPAMEKLLD